MTINWGEYGFRVTSPYGYRSDPFNGGTVFHTDIDIVKSHKAPICAFVAGEVVHAREGQAGTGSRPSVFRGDWLIFTCNIS
ncbi:MULTISPECIES: hypothetical protein [unclassified Paenibacillus]|uniref:hypothetical protein n=1 Tax=unclassified Paenibacillus TaxID=185978 RepID=UPI0025A2AD79|nr:hypothetical protein [Paenibacillus sp. S-12]